MARKTKTFTVKGQTVKEMQQGQEVVLMTGLSVEEARTARVRFEQANPKLIAWVEEDLDPEQISRATERAYSHPPFVRELPDGTFEVRSRVSGNVYRVDDARETCNCPAGQVRVLCYHRISVKAVSDGLKKLRAVKPAPKPMSARERATAGVTASRNPLTRRMEYRLNGMSI